MPAESKTTESRPERGKPAQGGPERCEPQRGEPLHCHLGGQLGRIEARTGLRMMPTFPRSPRSFRKAGFPQYGWKAGLSGGAFPDRQRLKPAPGMHLRTPGLPSPFVHLRVGAVVPYCAGSPTGRCTALEGGSPSAPGALARVRVMLSRSVLA